MRLRSVLCFALIACVAFVSCSGSAKKADVIKIGYFGPLTGDTALWGQAEFNTVKLRFDDINAQGGIKVGDKTYKLEAVGYDDKGDSTEAVNVVKRLTSQDHVVAIVGAQGSSEAIPVAPIANSAKVPVVATLATNPKVTVTESGSVNPYMFRACFTDPYQGKVAAYFAYQRLNKRNAAIFMTVDDAYSAGLSQYFKENFTALGGKIVAEVSFAAGEKEFRAPLTKIKAANPDIIFMPNYYTDVALSAKQARDLGINCVLLGGDGWPSENLISLAGNALEGCYYVNHLDFDSPDAKPFRDEYKAKYQKNAELNSYMTYDAISMVLDALQRAGAPDGEKIGAALATCDIQGLTGHIKIGPQHDPVGKDGWLIKIVGQNMVFQEKFSAQ